MLTANQQRDDDEISEAQNLMAAEIAGSARRDAGKGLLVGALVPLRRN